MIPRRTAEEKDIFFSDLGKLHFHRLDVLLWLLWLLGSPSYVRHVFRFCALALFHALVGVWLGGQAAPSRDPTPWVRRGGEMRKKVAMVTAVMPVVAVVTAALLMTAAVVGDGGSCGDSEEG